MKQLLLLVSLLTLNFASGVATADNCQLVFRCQGSICERAAPASCSPTQSNAVVYTTPSSLSMPKEEGATNNVNNSLFFDSAGNPRNIEPSPQPQRPIPLIVPSCAENGSCYGDVSNITGLAKTTHVNGYYRSDGTYVRGHYRSRK
jgi:hypothetical protein